MVVKIYISGISGNKEVKKRQQRVMMILDSKNVEYETIDITEPGKEEEKEFMQTSSNPKDNRHPLPPQIFNEFDYCGDYEDFDLANEMDELEKFLKLLPDSSEQSLSTENPRQNGNTTSREVSTEKEVSLGEDGSMRDDSKDDRQLSTAEEKSKSEEDKEEMEENVENNNEEKSDDQEKEE